jgi:8-oxo-dGTP pyrophosphatase MutT (NUDIX family)/DNA-binding XRE family transcriptional regulator
MLTIALGAMTVNIIDEWTGRHACALQRALRLTQSDYAAQLGVARRTIATWHEKPNVVISKELQRVLDTAYERANDTTKQRFLRQLQAEDESVPSTGSGGAVALTVSIAVVVREADVLIVCRRDSDPSGIAWQFPAGIIKPGMSPSVVAVRETLAETGVHCSVREHLGRRIHPKSEVNCEYFLCDFLAGAVENRDSAENVDAIWVPRAEITRFIPEETIYPPILRRLEKL